MKRTFLSGLIGTPGQRGNAVVSLVVLAMLIGGFLLRRGEDRGGAFIFQILGGIGVFLMLFNAWRKSR